MLKVRKTSQGSLCERNAKPTQQRWLRGEQRFCLPVYGLMAALWCCSDTQSSGEYCRCVFEHASSPVWRPRPPAFAAGSCFFDHSSPLWEHLFREPQPDKTRCSYCRAGRERGGEAQACTRHVNSNRFRISSRWLLHLFSCLSASLLGYMCKLPAWVGVCSLCARSAKVLRQRQLGVLKDAGGTLKPQSEGDCADGPRQKWKLGLAALFPAPRVCNSLGFGFERQKQGEKLSCR